MIHAYLPYVQFIAQLSLVAGAVFAGYQFLSHRRERNEQNALQVLTRLTSPEFREAYARIWTLPLQAQPQEIAEDEEMRQAVDAVTMTFEVIGVMVHNRMVPLDAVDQVIGGFLRESWRRVGPYIQWRREQVQSRRLAEWYQWLAERLAVESRRDQGAYDAFRDWRVA